MQCGHGFRGLGDALQVVLHSGQDIGQAGRLRLVVRSVRLVDRGGGLLQLAGGDHSSSSRSV